MDNIAQKAIKDSIKVWDWKRIDFQNGKPIHFGTIYCPLCQKFYNGGQCDLCPIYKRTGKIMCSDTPYHWVVDAHKKFLLREVEKDLVSDRIKAEIDFLKSLLVSQFIIKLDGVSNKCVLELLEKRGFNVEEVPLSIIFLYIKSNRKIDFGCDESYPKKIVEDGIYSCIVDLNSESITRVVELVDNFQPSKEVVKIDKYEIHLDYDKRMITNYCPCESFDFILQLADHIRSKKCGS